MRKQSTAPAGLASYKPAVELHTDVVFHVYGRSVYGELLGLGSLAEGLEPYEAIGITAVRTAVAVKTHGWDVTGPVFVHESPTGEQLTHGIELPMRLPVRSWLVVNTSDNTSEVWIWTADGGKALSELV